MSLGIQKTLVLTLLFLIVTPSALGIIQGKENQCFVASSPFLINESLADDITATKVARNMIYNYGKAKGYTLDEMETLYGESNRLLGYLFSLKPQGYIMVSAHKSLPPIISYSFDNDAPMMDRGLNPLQQLLKGDIQLRLENIHGLSPEIREKRRIMWHELLWKKNPTVFLNNFQQWPPRGTTSTGGWLETNWHQDSPYNDFCPLDMVTGEKSIGGCPAVTMAQIINYHDTLGTIYFNDSDDYHHNYGSNRYLIDDDHENFDFPSFPELNMYLDTLRSHYHMNMTLTDADKASLVFACGVAAHQVYSSEVSGTYGVNQAYQAYNRFGVTENELLTNKDPELFGRLRMNMVDGLPAHLAVVIPDWSGGHNLVVDGYNTEDYYHLNFGWGGSWNGWYLLPQELPYDLTMIEGVIVDIMNRHTGSDIYCKGSLSWGDIAPGETISGNFTIENRGDNGSVLEWKIVEWPEWGTWIFTPLDGGPLTPSDKPVRVNFSIVAPEKKNRALTGYIKVVNTNNVDDYFIVPVSLAFPIKIDVSLFPLLQFLQGLVNSLHCGMLWSAYA